MSNFDNMNIEQLTTAYLAARDNKKALEKNQKETLALIKDHMGLIEAALLKKMDENGLESAPNAAGTPYKSVVTTFPIKDWPTLLNHIVENDLLHMLGKSVAKATVAEYLEEEGVLPPGLDCRKETFIRVLGAKK